MGNYYRKELQMKDKDSPLNSYTTGHATLTSEEYFMTFEHSSLIKDAGQTTLPLLDAQKVEGEPDVPLGGIGLVHKGYSDNGGMLAFRLFSIHYSTFMSRFMEFAACH